MSVLMDGFDRIKKNETQLEDWHPADVICALRKSPGQWSLRRLAMHHGFAPSTMKQALRRPYPKMQRLIAEAIGVEPKVIWPSRYRERRRAA